MTGYCMKTLLLSLVLAGSVCASGDPVKDGHAAGPSREVATEHLSNDAQLIERNFASKPVGQGL